MFDVKELDAIYKDAFNGTYVALLETSTTPSDKTDMWQTARNDAILALAAYVRAKTLREAATICGELGTKHWDNYKGHGETGLRADPNEQGMSLGADECEEALNMLAANCQGKLDGSAASARETGGAVTLEQSAACLHERYGDALAKLDDAAPGERDGAK